MTREPNHAAFRHAIRASQIKRAARLMNEWAEHPRSLYAQLAFLDALQAVIDSDLSDEVETLCRELGIDAEGYPVDDCGYRKPRGDRVVVLGGGA